ncbi:MAG: hypothetical protein AAF533_07975 [Acidobacteriota bacterium]
MTRTMTTLLVLLLGIAPTSEAHAEPQVRLSVLAHVTEGGPSLEETRMTEALIPGGKAMSVTIGSFRDERLKNDCIHPLQLNHSWMTEIEEFEDATESRANNITEMLSLEHVWFVAVRVLTLDTDHLELEASWKRLEWVGPRFEVVAADRSTLSYPIEEEGPLAPRHLDYRAFEDDGDCPLRSMLLSIEPEPVLEPSLTDAVIMLDVGYHWWEPGSSRGLNTLERTQHGESLSYRFPQPDGWQVADAAIGPHEHLLDLTGHVVAHAQDDGMVEITMSVKRRVGVRLEDGSTSFGTFEGGEKTFRVRPGEQVALELPRETGGFHGFRETVSTRSDEPLDAGDWDVVVDSRQFHAERRQQLLISVRRVGPMAGVMPSGSRRVLKP